MKRVGVREFTDNATALIDEEKGLVIEKHGKPVGFYIPIPEKDKVKAEEAARRLEGTIESILERTGMTREELIEFFTSDWEESVRSAPRD